MPYYPQTLLSSWYWPQKSPSGNKQYAWPSNAVISERVRGNLPSGLKAAMEAITGVNLQRVRVHYNSTMPAKVQAHAYAQGLDIYLAPGQEHHLPHELGHVVQQLNGMVKPTRTINGVEINDDERLEQHATLLGQQALKRAGLV
ncbi:eCIS core domain-containing protein [Shewanella surugensis]|uniref:DUF4157 domain-containing protein n=1 Tax=Shewanella surugensis TaxID=212020 RepID=A0ABT0LEH7_9GAMM|nr:DUF4157 domain-containing protein [Shewanella surugensis]MCL1126109.1 DUF4157 domain-containing protein [Shewanella surugensis]